MITDMTSTALWGTDRDITALRRMDFAARRQQLHQAPHRYAGTVQIVGDRLVLRGVDVFTAAPAELQIPLDSLASLEIGYDDVLPHDAAPARPLRLSFRAGGRTRTVYAFFDWRARTGSTDNAGWLALLRERTRVAANG